MENKSLNVGKKSEFDSEFILHKLTEKYIKEKNLFGLIYVGSEIQYKKLRIDTLALDDKKETLVIIEYKNKKDKNVITQVQGYYKLLKEVSEKEDIPQEFTNLSFDIKKKYFKNIQAMIIAPEFYKDIEKESEKLDYLELYTISLCKCNDEKAYVTYEKNSDKNMHCDSNEKRLEAVQKDLEITREDVLRYKSPEIVELYNDFEESLDELECIKFNYLVDAVSVKGNNNFICNVSVKESIKIYFYTHKLNEINKMLDEDNCRKKNLRNIAYLTTGGPLVYFELTLTSDEIGYAKEKIQQINKAKNGGKK